MEKSIKILLFHLLILGVVYASTEAKSPLFNTTATIPESPIYQIKDFKSRNLKSGVLRIEGYIVKIYTCPPCPEGASCKPCMEDNIVISENNKIIENYSQVARTELIVFVKNPREFKLGRKYKLLVKIRDVKSTLEPINDLELVSYELLE